MGFELSKLNALKVQKIATPGRYGDGGGLWLQVSPTGTKAWLFRYTMGGKARQMGLGALHTVSLAEARERAQMARRLVLDGVDPLQAKESKRQRLALEIAKAMTFEQCATSYIKDHEGSWRNAKHRQQWSNSLATYAYPTIGRLAVGDIDVALVTKVLEPIWQEKPETASRVRMRLETVLAWATARGFRQGENPARWRGHLDQLLPSRKKLARVVHHPALPFREIGAFVRDLRSRDGVAARCLEFLILTACRTNEAVGARFSEFDLQKRLWLIPAERMKAGREHRVALSDRAVSIIQAQAVRSEFVFATAGDATPISNMAMLTLLRRMGRSDVTIHGFRSSFRDWCAEMTNHPRELAEMALAHTVGDKVEAAYRRGDMFTKRLVLAEEWSKYCNSPLTADSTVVSLRVQNNG